jgi:DNA polymerase-3 subunit gamma/tau
MMSTPAPYRVLARKYRPKSFADLIGQDTMVRVLSNAFATDRIAQAYMLSGVRGVGKTTTARLIARALNYPSGPTVDMAELTPQCEAILEARHIDVIEMDAASNTGVDNMREIIESVRYAPVEARTKVYIIDEVHMLSKSAFNALLKTLEEPPPHVKFIFATTEIRKVPVTILSRCQRFDLKRLDAGLLAEHYGRICRLENVEADGESLRLIARAAEGSVRDGLSLLDQAIAFGDGQVNVQDVLSMLGVADRTRVIELFEAVMAGDAARAVAEMALQHEGGADPQTILGDLADFTHWVTRLKVAQTSAERDSSRTELEKSKGKDLAARLSLPALARAWQMLLKGLGETASAPRPEQAAEMVLIRLAHAANLPSGTELARLVSESRPAAAGPAVAPAMTSSVTRRELSRPDFQPMQTAIKPETSLAAKVAPTAPAAPPEQPMAFADFSRLVAYVAERRDIKLKTELERFVRPILVAPGRIELALEDGAPANLPGELSRKLEMWTSRRWMVTLATSGGEPSLVSRRKAEADSAIGEALRRADVKAYLKAFPGAEVTKVREPEIPAAATDMPQDDSDEEHR